MRRRNRLTGEHFETTEVVEEGGVDGSARLHLNGEQIAPAIHDQVDLSTAVVAPVMQPCTNASVRERLRHLTHHPSLEK